MGFAQLPLRFGIHVGQQQRTFDDYIRLLRRVDALGFDWGSVFDHLLSDEGDIEGACFEGLTTLTAVACNTTSIRCGILVVCSTLRNPSLLAKMATTLDHISHGRLELGLGAGWNQVEHRMFGFYFPPTSERMLMLLDTVKILKALWSGKRTTYESSAHVLRDAVCKPVPLQRPHIPIWVGGEGESMLLRIAAEVADGWNCYKMPIVEYRRKIEILRRYCQNYDRDFDDIRKSIVFPIRLSKNNNDRNNIVQTLSNKIGVSTNEIQQRMVIGTSEQCIEIIAPYINEKLGDIIFDIGNGDVVQDMENIEIIAQKIVPNLRMERK